MPQKEMHEITRRAAALVHIKDPAKLDEAAINKLPNSGIVKKGTDIQIVYGLQVADIKRAVEAQLENQ